MKYLCLLLFLVIYSHGDWELKNISFVTENDADFRTDRDYTYGSELSILYKTEEAHYISFGIAHQMFTPKDFDKENVDLSKERPYAGYIFFDSGFHTVTNGILDSLNIQVGFVGPSTKMDRVQKIIHSLIGSPDPKGWDEQIGDELILQLDFERRWYVKTQKLFGLQSALIPYCGINLGNASTLAAGGFVYTFGWNLPRDFGSRRIDYRGYNNIPLTETKTSKESFVFELWLESDAVARNIFLDGNTFKESVHVKKRNFLLKGGFGLGYRYDRWRFNYLRTYSTKEFVTQSYYHSYGSFLVGYDF